jgi:hypothetical protein
MPEARMHINEVISEIKLGCTAPMHARADDGTRVVIKTIQKGQGNRVLFNEHFAYQLAHYLAVPTPEYFVGLIDGDTSGIYRTEYERELCFCSRLITPVVTILPEFIQRISNFDSIYDILLFDHLVCNADRNVGNMIWQTKQPYLMYAIDYSHIFGDTDSWTSDQLRKDTSVDETSCKLVMNCNAEMYQMFIPRMKLSYEFFQERLDLRYTSLSEELFRDILWNTPNEWLPNPEDCDALLRYLGFRLKHMPEYIRKGILGQGQEGR